MLRRHAKIIAVLLLLVFSQRAGLRLWMHHWLHECKSSSSSSLPGSDKFSLACDCFNEAMLPMEEASVFSLSAPVFINFLGDAPPCSAPAIYKVYHSLKGPPVPVVCS